eukprot:366230-Chlamydomonas_euryale.AAC.24
MLARALVGDGSHIVGGGMRDDRLTRPRGTRRAMHGRVRRGCRPGSLWPRRGGETSPRCC